MSYAWTAGVRSFFHNLNSIFVHLLFILSVHISLYIMAFWQKRHGFLPLEAMLFLSFRFEQFRRTFASLFERQKVL